MFAAKVFKISLSFCSAAFALKFKKLSAINVATSEKRLFLIKFMSFKNRLFLVKKLPMTPTQSKKYPM